MPVLSLIASIAVLLSIFGVGFGLGVFPEIFADDGAIDPVGLLLVAALYILLAFVGLFFNAAVVAAANERLSGGDPTVGSALKAAWAKKGKLFLWSIVVATVNVILQAIRERSGFVGQMMAGLAGIAWNLATFFMIPVLLFEDESIGSSLKKSGGLFKKTWGETVVGEAGVGLFTMVLGLGVALMAFITFMVLSVNPILFALGLTVTILAGLFVAALGPVVSGVYKTALYRYATTGTGGGAFDDQVLAGSFHQ